MPQYATPYGMPAAPHMRIAFVAPAGYGYGYGYGWGLDGPVGYAAEGAIPYDSQLLAAQQASIERCVHAGTFVNRNGMVSTV